MVLFTQTAPTGIIPVSILKTKNILYLYAAPERTDWSQDQSFPHTDLEDV